MSLKILEKIKTNTSATKQLIRTKSEIENEIFNLKYSPTPQEESNIIDDDEFLKSLISEKEFLSERDVKAGEKLLKAYIYFLAEP